MRVSLQVSRVGAEPPMLGVAVERESLASNLHMRMCACNVHVHSCMHVHMYMGIMVTAMFAICFT